MTAAQWRSKIKKQCEDIGTYKQSYNSVIDALAKILEQRDSAIELAKILEQRDSAIEQFRKDGSQLLCEKTSDRGAVNQTINPLVQLINQLNGTALSYWKELGLTPLAYKKMTTGAAESTGEKPTGLAAILRSIESE